MYSTNTDTMYSTNTDNTKTVLCILIHGRVFGLNS